MTYLTDTLTPKRKEAGSSLSAASVIRSMRKINRTKRSAQLFLKRIGVSYSKTGKLRVRPI